MKASKIKLNHVVALMTALSAASCGVKTKAGSVLASDSSQAKAVALSVKSVGNVGVNLLNKLPADNNGNRFISPLSIQTALSMLAEGADAQTLTQIESVLGGSIDEINASNVALTDAMLGSSDYKLEIANSMWTGKGLEIKPRFQQLLNRHYQATAQSVDFEDDSTSGIINQWASDKTHGMIPKVVDKVDPSTRLMIANATYFEADWRAQFLSPHADKFTTSKGQLLSVPTLHSLVPQNYVQGSDYQATLRRYGKNGDAAMVIIRPAGDLASFSKKLTGDALEGIVASVNAAQPKMLKFSMPAISFSYEAELNQSLQSLGMLDVFEDNANLSNISAEPLKVSTVSHKTFVRIDEKGTKAAAVTTIGAVPASIPPTPEAVMNVDKPYLFAIVEAKTGAIIFVGSVETPVNAQ